MTQGKSLKRLKSLMGSSVGAVAGVADNFWKAITRGVVGVSTKTKVLIPRNTLGFSAQWILVTLLVALLLLLAAYAIRAETIGVVLSSSLSLLILSVYLMRGETHEGMASALKEPIVNSNPSTVKPKEYSGILWYLSYGPFLRFVSRIVALTIAVVSVLHIPASMFTVLAALVGAAAENGALSITALAMFFVMIYILMNVVVVLRWSAFVTYDISVSVYHLTEGAFAFTRSLFVVKGKKGSTKTKAPAPSKKKATPVEASTGEENPSDGTPTGNEDPPEETPVSDKATPKKGGKKPAAKK